MTMESEYLNLIQDVLMNGVKKMDRTGTGTLSVFGRQIRCDLNKGFPAITTKKLFWKGVVGELLWLLSGSTNVKPLQDQDIHIWDAWADKETGELGPVYGKQWRNWTQYAYVQGETPLTFERIKSNRIDQIANVIETIKTNPDSRRMVVSAWNVGQLSQMALEPCHAFFQFYTREIPVNERVMLLGHKYGGEIRAKTNDPKFMEAILAQEKIPTRYLDCQMYQRSADLFLGVPFNIASYALLTHMIAQVTGLQVGELVITFGDAHIYLNHRDQVNEMLSRDPRVLPVLRLNPAIQDIDGFQLADAELVGYLPYPAIAAPIAI
jgi:thymidylate synthase